jgi:hypothetical protein
VLCFVQRTGRRVSAGTAQQREIHAHRRARD